MGRRDVRFWQRLAADASGPVLELGCGTGRISLPLTRAGIELVGVDRSAAMLAIARRHGRQRSRARLQLARADIRALPFPDATFRLVMAPYGILQSLLSADDVAMLLASAARVLEPGGRLGIDLVVELPRWPPYTNEIRLRGRPRPDTHLTLIESVRQERSRRVTIFDQQFVERRGGRSDTHRFQLRFRTPSMTELKGQLARAGFSVESMSGDYAGTPWRSGSGACVIVARRV